MKKIKSIYYIICIAICFSMASCVDDESFSTSTSNLLSFSVDTVSLDTTFSNVPTPTKSLWVYNRTGDGLRCSSVRLEGGNQIGFRVNVDGTYLSQASGYMAQGVEIRKGDSIRVYVELTSRTQNVDVPKLVEDNLLFNLESGVQQKVNLKAYSWDAELLQDGFRVGRGENKEIGGTSPVVIYKGIRVDSTGVLTIKPGSTIYLHENAAIDVYGTLRSEGSAEQMIVLRGDRIDHMFDYLPYDRTPGQWQGIRLHSSSVNNKISYTDIHSAYNGILVDSCHDATIAALSKLDLRNSTVHNCMGYGVKIDSAAIVKIDNCQLSNTLSNCLSVNGAKEVLVNNTTIAQFYPFDSRCGAALSFTAPIDTLGISNSIVTGYADDEVMGSKIEDKPFAFGFDHCVLRTEKPNSVDSLRLTDVFYEKIDADSVAQGDGYVYFGSKHFVNMDTQNRYYDFHLSNQSVAVGWANKETSSEEDHDGKPRDKEKPDAGCYQHQEKQEAADHEDK